MSVPKIIQDIRELRSRALDANKTVYLSPSGNDTTGNGTAQYPYRTFYKALSVFPKNLNGKSAIINVTAGSYPEAVEISGFSNGVLRFIGVTNAVATVSSLTIDGCNVNVLSLGFSTSANTGVTVTNGGNFVSTGTLLSTGTSVGILITNLSSLNVTGTVTIRNAATGVSATNNSKAHFNLLSGSTVTTGLSASNGSKITYGQALIIATTAAFTSSGGRIYSDAQYSIPEF